MNMYSDTRSPSFVQGFTLLELVIAMMIVAILASIAYPAYREHVQRGRRAEAKAILMEMAQFMERHYSQTNSYGQASLPVATSPRSGTPLYSVKFGATCAPGENTVATNAAADCFLIQAIPVPAGAM